MKPYVDFEFYQKEYFGSSIVEEVVFKRMAQKASYLLNQTTFNRIVEPDEDVKMAVCAVAEIEFREYQEQKEDQISSETVGPHSVSYVRKTTTQKDFQEEKLSIIKIYLAGSPLLYRGLSL